MLTAESPVLDVLALSPIDRYKALVKFQMEGRVDFMASKGRCQNCVLRESFCVCSKLGNLEMHASDLDFTVVVLMNQREKYRSSNTAKVIEKILNAKIFIDGLDDDFIEFQKLVSENLNNCFVLFPSEDALDFPSFARNEKASCSSRLDSRKTLIIVVDGTWRQARRLNQKISPSIPRVKIMPTTLSKFLCRRQTQADRVCTIEALSLLLLDMQKSQASRRLDEGLATLVQGFNMQCYGSTHRPASMLKDLPSGRSLPPPHPDTLVDPSS